MFSPVHAFAIEGVLFSRVPVKIATMLNSCGSDNV